MVFQVGSRNKQAWECLFEQSVLVAKANGFVDRVFEPIANQCCTELICSV